MAACWCRQCGSLFFRHPNHSVNPASKTSKPKPQPSDIQTGHSTLRQNTFDKFPRSDFCGLSETSALMGICPKSLILSHFITLYFSTRDIKQTVSTLLDTCWLMSQYWNISPYYEPIFDCSRKHIYRHILPLFNPQPKPFSLSETYRVFLVATIYKQHMSHHRLKPGLAF